MKKVCYIFLIANIIGCVLLTISFFRLELYDDLLFTIGCLAAIILLINGVLFYFMLPNRIDNIEYYLELTLNKAIRIEKEIDNKKPL